MTKVLTADVVVVGAGVYGSSTALHLARAGKDTILLDQFPLPHGRGSSHGQSRIIREANYGIPELSPIMTAGYNQWRSIQAQSGMTLIRPQPLLMVGRGGQRSQMERVAGSVEKAGHQPQWMTPETINNKYKMNLSSSDLAFFDPSAGILMADKCLAALMQLYRSSAGGRVVEEWCVEEVVVDEGGVVEVMGPQGTVKAKGIVLCPGPWAAPILAKMGVHIPLRVERISVLYWRLKDHTTPTTTFVDLSDKDHCYGLPEIEYPGMIKVCLHGGPEVEPNYRDQQGAALVAFRNRMKDYVKRRIPGVYPEPAVEEACLYTVTPDHEFVVDRHPQHPNVVFACGFSGTGFKMAPAIGEDLSRLVMGLAPQHNLKPFSAARFSTTTRSKM